MGHKRSIQDSQNGIMCDLAQCKNDSCAVHFFREPLFSAQLDFSSGGFVSRGKALHSIRDPDAYRHPLFVETLAVTEPVLKPPRRLVPHEWKSGSICSHSPGGETKKQERGIGGSKGRYWSVVPVGLNG